MSDCAVPSIQHTGIAAVTVRIKAYNATGELDIRRDPFTLGTRVLLTCDVTGLPEGSEVERYRWFRSCTGGHQGRCEIHNPVPYYKTVKDTLLVDVTSCDQGEMYICFVRLTETSPWSIGKIHIRWYHNCINRPCEIRDGDPYYKVVKDTLLVDVTSLDQRGRYYCNAAITRDLNADSLPVTKAAIIRGDTSELAVVG